MFKGWAVRLSDGTHKEVCLVAIVAIATARSNKFIFHIHFWRIW